MTGISDSERRQALQPVRAQLIRRARADADATLAAAHADAAAQVAAARARAKAILDEARAQGEASAAAESAARHSSARRRARTSELDAERSVYEAVRDGVERGVLALHEAPDYAELHDGLERCAREPLGPDADVTRDPRGGVIATAPGRLVDLSLAAIAARTVDALGEEVARLWTR